jgi:hypothetical protein
MPGISSSATTYSRAVRQVSFDPVELPRGIFDALTGDYDFEQAGLRALLK